MTESAPEIDFMMEELFTFRRLGQPPREAMESVLEHMVRPENPRLADDLKVHCVDALPETEGEARLFIGFVLQFVALLQGTAGNRPELERLAPLIHESYARHRSAFEQAGTPMALTPELKRVDALLKEHHRWLHALGTIEKYAYWGVLVVFPVLWLGLKWAWWQAALAQLGLYAVMVLLSFQIAGLQVRRTVSRIAKVCSPQGPHYEPALRMISGYDREHVQLLEDVIKGVRALKA
jgi:hypothetical protein